MIDDKTYYQILGVAGDAEDVVIKAAYRSLSQKYHPDKWQGDPKVAQERMSKINRAYETLSDPVEKRAYDNELKTSGVEEDFSDEAFEEYFKDRQSDWEYACNHVSTLAELSDQLHTIHPALSLTFREILLQTKNFNSAESVFRHVKKLFFQRYFGDSKAIHKFAEEALLSGRRDVARELNKAIRILGNSVNENDLIQRLRDKYNYPQSISKVGSSNDQQEEQIPFEETNLGIVLVAILSLVIAGFVSSFFF